MRLIILYFTVLVLFSSFVFGAYADGLIHSYWLNVTDFTDHVGTLDLTDNAGADTGMGYSPEGVLNRFQNADSEELITAAYDFPPEITVCVTKNITGVDGWIQQMYNTMGGNDDIITLYQYLGSTQLKCETYGDAAWQTAASTSGVSQNEWHHICCVSNMSYVAIYIDGTLNNSKAFGTKDSGGGTGAMNFGDTGTQGNNQINDDINIWNRTLSSAEISGIYNGGDILTAQNGFSSGADTTAPVASDWNYTHGNIVSGETSTVWNDGGVINITTNNATLTVTADENSNMSCRLDNEGNYSEMVADNINYKAATTETTSHSYAVYDNISIGNHCLYCSMIDSLGNEPVTGSSTSGCLNITYIDNCDCNGIDVNKEYNYSKNCQINNDCDMGNGNISWIGSGNWYCNATINVANMDEPTSNVWIQSGCFLNITG